jgi:NhaA family Na+:H+ antiporter
MKMIKDFFHKETSVGILLIISTIIALILANTPLKTFYTKFLDIPLGVVFGGLEIQKPLILWVNDGLMAIFFFLVGLEIKEKS